MSESAPNILVNAELPVPLARRDGTEATDLVIKETSNGQHRAYTLNEEGKHEAVSLDSVLEAHGYAARTLEEGIVNAAAPNVVTPPVDLNKPQTPEAATPTFGSVFEEVNSKVSKDKANEIMDLAVEHEEIFAKMPVTEDEEKQRKTLEDLTIEEQQKVTALIDKYGINAIDMARRASLGMQNGDYAREGAQAKIETLQRMKRARGKGDTSDLDKRINALNQAIERTEASEVTRNNIYRTKAERTAYNETRDIDAYEFWGMEGGDNGNGENNDEGNVDTNVSPAFAEALNEGVEILAHARNDYANESAKAQRSTFGRFLLGDQKRVGKLIRKNNKLSGLIDKFNDWRDKPVMAAKEAYETQIDQIGALVANLYRSAGVPEDQLRGLAANALMEESVALLKATADYSIGLANGAGRNKVSEFLNNLQPYKSLQEKNGQFWAQNSINQEDPNKRNLKGMAKKGVAMAGIGLAIGTGAGVFGLGAWAGAAIGGGVTSLIARNANRRQAAAEVEIDRDGNTMRYADYKLAPRANAMHGSLNESTSQGDGFARAEDISKVQEHYTDQEMLKNRRRIRLAFAAGAMGARAGVSLGSGLRNMFEGGGSGKSDAANASEGNGNSNGSGSSAGESTPADVPENLPNWTDKQWDDFGRMQEWFNNGQQNGMSRQELLDIWNNPDNWENLKNAKSGGTTAHTL